MDTRIYRSGVAMDEEGKSAVAPFIQKERFKLGTDSSCELSDPDRQ